MPPGPAGAAAALRAGGRAHSGAAAPMVGGGSLAGSKDGRSGGSRISGGIKSSKDTNHASHSLRNGAGKHGVNNAGGHAADHHSSNNSQRTSSSGNAGKLGAETSRQLQTALAPASSTGGAASASVAPAACSTVATCGSGGAAADEDSDDLMSSKNDDIAKKLEQAEKLSAAMRVLKFAVPAKNLLSCYLLGPVVLGECRTERLCMPWVNVLLLVVDISVFTGHLIMGIKRRAYREHILAYNFYILSVFWSVWNLCSHPLCRQYVVDLFVAPPELHVTINIVAIAVCSSAIMSPPSMRHLIGLVTWEFLISLVLSSVEVMNFTMDTGWLAAVPKLGGEDSNETMGMRPDVSESTIAEVEQVMFNIAILLIGSTIILGTMTVEKDFKSLAHEMERLGPSGTFEDDLERRKRAVLTALCDAVLTTNAQFQVTGSDDGADRIFRRPMLDQQLGDFFKDQAEKDRFFASVKKQFPEDDSVGEGPKRMRASVHGDRRARSAMLSVALQKNPNLKTKYWAEVCCRDDRAHIFHAKHSMNTASRSTPLSTSQSNYYGGKALPHGVDIASEALELSRHRAPAHLGAAARSTLTPRRQPLAERPRAYQAGCLTAIPVTGDHFARSGRPGLVAAHERPPAGL